VVIVVARFNDSPCWKALLKVKDTYFAGRKVILGNGEITRLWKDPLLGNRPYCEHFPALYDLYQLQDCSIKTFVDANFDIPFRGQLRGDLLVQRNSIVEKIGMLPLSNENDKISWSLNKNSMFSTKPVYKMLVKNLAGSSNT
jgi:hypothetical protein